MSTEEPKKVLKERKVEGQVDASVKAALGKRLKRRMSKIDFNNKFIQREQKQSIKNRQSRLDQLFAVRPSRQRLLDTNIIKKGAAGPLQAAQLRLQSERSKLQLNKMIKNRENRDVLVSRNVIKERTGAAGSLQARRVQMKQFQTQRLLDKMISSRSSRGQLKSKGILMDIIEEEEEDDYNEALVTEDSKNALASLIAKRSDKKALQSRNILVSGDGNNSKVQKTAALGAFLKRRPSLALLRKQKLLTDIGASQYGDDIHESTNGTVTSPQEVTALADAKIVHVSAAWGHTVVLNSEGIVSTFGNSSEGRLGLGEDAKTSTVPAVVETLKAAGKTTMIDAGDNHTVAVVDGALYSWGVGGWGRLGQGSQDSSTAPVRVEVDGKVKAAVCGSCHTLVLTESNNVFGFGWNKSGRVGIGSEYKINNGDSVVVPVPLGLLNSQDIKVTSLVAGSNISLALDAKGNVYTWGSGAWGGLGHGNEDDLWVPEQVQFFQDLADPVVLAAAGSSHIVVLTGSGKLYSWGQNKQGQLGRATGETGVPALVDLDGAGVTAITCGKSNTAIIKNGELFTFGSNSRSVLGHSSAETQVQTPTKVSGLSNVVDVALSWVHTVALTGDGKVHTWGSDQYGKLGHVAAA